jgi:hypothetical protein
MDTVAENVGNVTPFCRENTKWDKKVLSCLQIRRKIVLTRDICELRFLLKYEFGVF